MASLTNTKIKNTYVSLLKVADNGQLDAALQDITDGAGNTTGIQLNTGGDLTASGTISFGSLKDTGENITITKFVDAADGIGSNDNDTTIPTSAAVKLYVDTNITAQDLDFATDSGTGAVDLDSQTFSILGTANEIETSGTGQTVTIGLPSSITVDVTGNLTGNVSGNVTGNVTGNLSGNVTGNVTGDLTGNVTATSVLVDGVTATTQSIGDNSTKVATTAYVDAAITAEGLDFAGDSGTGTIDLDSEVFTIAGTANEIETSATGNSLIVGLPSNVTIGNDLTVTTNASVGGTFGVTGTTTLTGDLAVDTDTLFVDVSEDRVGINKAVPAVALDVVGDITSSGTVTGATLTGTLSTAAQTNITSVGTLSSLAVSGDLTVDTSTLKVDSTNNIVGIGTIPTSGTGNLQIGGSAQASLFSQQGTDTVRAGVRATGRTGIVFDSSDATYTNRMWYIDNLGSSGKLVIGRNGLDVATFDNSGNVGIGVSPSYKLDVGGASNTDSTARFAKTSEGSLLLGGNRSTSNCPFIGSENNYDFAFITNNTERMRIDSSGNVGIGESNPSSKLSIGGVQGSTLGNNVALLVGNTGAGATVGNLFQIGLHYNPAGSIPSSVIGSVITSSTGFTKSDIFFATRDVTTDTAPTERLRVDSSGKISIKPSNESIDSLRIYRGTDSGYEFQSAIIDAQNGYTNIRNLATDSPRAITFSFSSDGTSSYSERMRITSGGNLAVGNTSGTGGRVHITGENSANTANAIYVENSSSAAMFQVRNDGLVNTGTAAASPYNNTTGNAANLTVSATGTFERSTSSLKYKTDVRDYDKGLDIIDSLRPVYYKGINDGDKQFAGLIAEEVHDLGLEEFVQYAQDGSPDALAYTHIVALLINGIKELRAEIESLKSQINA